MNFFSKYFINILFLIILLLYVIFFEISVENSRIDAILTLFFSSILLFKSRKVLPYSVATFFIFYCVYSIVVGEYIVGGELGVPLYEVKTEHIYGLAIRIMLVFISIISVLFNGKNFDINRFVLVPKDNPLIFSLNILLLIYIATFGINRSISDTYTVNITALYEYSLLIFLFAYYYSGKHAFNKILILLLFIIITLQDLYFGGRITSIQLLILLFTTFFLKKLSFNGVIFYGFIGIFINSFIGVYRNTFSLEATSLVSTFIKLKDNLFVFDTPIYAYYASATHIAAENLVDTGTKIHSFLSFGSSVVLGINNEFSNLTNFISNNFYLNIGGGLIPTYFYFWFGWFGVIFVSFLVVFILNKIKTVNTDFQKMIVIVIIATVPRWFLYNPLNLFRPLLILAVLYILFSLLHNLTSRFKR